MDAIVKSEQVMFEGAKITIHFDEDDSCWPFGPGGWLP